MPAFGLLDALVLPAFRLVLPLGALIRRLQVRREEMRWGLGGGHAARAGGCHCGWWQSMLHCCVGNVGRVRRGKACRQARACDLAYEVVRD